MKMQLLQINVALEQEEEEGEHGNDVSFDGKIVGGAVGAVGVAGLIAFAAFNRARKPVNSNSNNGDDKKTTESTDLSVL